MELIQQLHDRDLASVKALFLIKLLFLAFLIWQEFDFLYGNFLFCNQSPNVFLLNYFWPIFWRGTYSNSKVNFLKIGMVRY